MRDRLRISPMGEKIYLAVAHKRDSGSICDDSLMVNGLFQAP